MESFSFFLKNKPRKTHIFAYLCPKQANSHRTMKVKIEESWRLRLQEEFDKPYFERLTAFVRNEYARAHVLPPGSRIFYIFNACPFEKVKVVILGQDPYPTPGQYYGVCFSVPDGIPIPGSLANIFQEIHQDLGKPVPASGKGIQNRFPPQRRMGNVHRCRHPQAQRGTGTSGFHAMGKLCKSQKEPD